MNKLFELFEVNSNAEVALYCLRHPEDERSIELTAFLEQYNDAQREE